MGRRGAEGGRQRAAGVGVFRRGGVVGAAAEELGAGLGAELGGGGDGC